MAQEDNVDELKKELEEAKAKCEEYLNGWKRERADFLNHKKEEMERISQLVNYANEELILKIIPILDNIYLAETHIPPALKGECPPSPEASEGQTIHAWIVWIEGFNHIKNQLCDFLKKEGIEPIESVGKPFDPNTMEATEEIEDKKKETGTVIEEVQKGYTMRGKLIRPAKVRIVK